MKYYSIIKKRKSLHLLENEWKLRPLSDINQIQTVKYYIDSYIGNLRHKQMNERVKQR